MRAADSAGERRSASVLINRMYSGRGYRHNPLPEDDDPNRLTLVARDHNAVIGTLTIGFDSNAGLLVDEIFHDEVDALRGAGRQVCEFTKLAMEGVVRSQHVLAAMFHVAFIQAHRIRGCDNLLIEVNPRHTRYYETKLGFQRLGRSGSIVASTRRRSCCHWISGTRTIRWTSSAASRGFMQGKDPCTRSASRSARRLASSNGCEDSNAVPRERVHSERSGSTSLNQFFIDEWMSLRVENCCVVLAGSQATGGRRLRRTHDRRSRQPIKYSMLLWSRRRVGGSAALGVCPSCARCGRGSCCRSRCSVELLPGRVSPSWSGLRSRPVLHALRRP